MDLEEQVINLLESLSNQGWSCRLNNASAEIILLVPDVENQCCIFVVSDETGY